MGQWAQKVQLQHIVEVQQLVAEVEQQQPQMMMILHWTFQLQHGQQRDQQLIQQQHHQQLQPSGQTLKVAGAVAALVLVDGPEEHELEHLVEEQLCF